MSYSAQRQDGKERRQIGGSVQGGGITGSTGGQEQRRSRGKGSGDWRERREEQGQCSHWKEHKFSDIQQRQAENSIWKIMAGIKIQSQVSNAFEFKN